jgi:hypothetical protein
MIIAHSLASVEAESVLAMLLPVVPHDFQDCVREE